MGAGRGRGRSIRLLFHLVLTKSPCSFLVGRSKPKALHFSAGRSNFPLRLRSTPPSAIRHPSGGRFATTALPPHPPTQSIDHPGQIRTRTEVDKTQTAHYQQKTCPFLATFERERERERENTQRTRYAGVIISSVPCVLNPSSLESNLPSPRLLYCTST